jgi:hypothetical protein
MSRVFHLRFLSLLFIVLVVIVVAAVVVVVVVVVVVGIVCVPVLKAADHHNRLWDTQINNNK